MAEYIDRAEYCEKHCRCSNEYCDRQSCPIWKAPAADVAPVVHGDWLLRHIGVGHYWECSACHTNPCIYVTEHTKFCPNCGAKMDGGADDAF